MAKATDIGGKTNSQGAAKFAANLLAQASKAKTNSAKKAALKTAIGLTQARTSVAAKQIAANQTTADAAIADILSPDKVAELQAGEDAAAQASKDAKKTIQDIQDWKNPDVPPLDSAVAGSSGQSFGNDRTLAKDTFRNTLALYFGSQEVSQPWVDALYKSVAGFYNTGSTVEESLNLSLMDVRNNPNLKPFTDRFKGVYALHDRLAKGEAIEVPTIAEFFKSESAMGDVLRSVGLGELATQNFLGDVIGRGKSVLEVSNLISETFNAIDNAPDALKKDLQTYFPGVDRTSLAKALLTGTEGWQELSKKVRMVGSLSAARSQGVNISEATAQDIANMGYDYNQSLSGFQQVKELERGQMLGKMSGINFGQEEAIGATFKQDAKALADIERIKKDEVGRYSGSAGRLASRDRNIGIF